MGDASPSTYVYDVFRLPTPVSTSNLQKYRAVRLAALQTDPTFFLSTYQQEVAFTDDVWRERLNGEGKFTIVARADIRDHGRKEPGAEHGEGASQEEESESAEDAPFVGTVTLVAARSLPASMVPDFADSKTAYFIVAMWVAPEHRRRGLGRRLMEAALACAAEDTKAPTGALEGDNVGTKAEVILEVTLENERAKRMYEGLGFETFLVKPAEGGGEAWMRRHVTVD
ncbi:hypothetical protein OH77DRAFT_1428551 [Trametes cingulata]|nr:hypothetical protein OH77DRAFT_1428551 [Trametes cingulata]